MFVIDDFLNEINKSLVEIICVSSRHLKVSCLILNQNLFGSNANLRQISLNVKYIHILKNPRELSQFQYLARQIRPGDYRWLINAFHEATKKPFSCFVIDLTQAMDDSFRFRSNDLSNEPIKFWMKKDTRI